MKKIGVLTSGGDSPGMNAAIRAVVRKGIYHGFEMVGIERGYRGLLEAQFIPLKTTDVSNILFQGGTFLRSARCKEFQEGEGVKKGASILKDNKIDALIVIGGDGSFMGAKELSNLGIRTIGIPGTIDNDLGYTDYTIGFDTAITTVMDAVAKLRDTSSSHGRAFVVEVMGRDCGDIALHAGIVSGAEAVIVPEVDWSFNSIIEDMKARMERGKNHYIILVSEGVKNPYEFTEEIEKRTGVTTRLAVIGYMQRGGAPTAFDRMLATRMGAKAIDLLLDDRTGEAIGMKGTELISMDIHEAVSVRDRLNMELYGLADILAR